MWPSSVTTLHVQWDYDEVKYINALMDVGLNLTEFQIEISSGSVILVRIDSIPPRRRRYMYTHIYVIIVRIRAPTNLRILTPLY